MMPIFLRERFEQLLGFAKDSRYKVTAYENLAAAKEMADTLFHCEFLTIDEYNELRACVMCVQLVVSGAELKRAQDSLRLSINAWDGTRVMSPVSPDGLHAINLSTGYIDRVKP